MSEQKIIKENKETFSRKVMEMVWEKDVSYIDALTEVSEKLEYEPAHVAKLISEDLRALLQYEAENLNLIKKSEQGRLE